MLAIWRRTAATAILATLFGAFGTVPVSLHAEDRPGDFDFYLLSLSWSPSYCLTEGASANSRQCGGSEPKAFVVHGLWPQYNRGYPEYCRSPEPQRVPRSLINTMLDIMPSPGLIGGQWRKHGTCTGLSQSEYLGLTRQAFERINIPDQFEHGDQRRVISAQSVEQAFVSANPGLSASGIAISCKNGHVSEVRICLSRSIEFRSCKNVDRRGCRAARLMMPEAR